MTPGSHRDPGTKSACKLNGVYDVVFPVSFDDSERLTGWPPVVKDATNPGPFPAHIVSPDDGKGRGQLRLCKRKKVDLRHGKEVVRRRVSKRDCPVNSVILSLQLLGSLPADYGIGMP